MAFLLAASSSSGWKKTDPGIYQTETYWAYPSPLRLIEDAPGKIAVIKNNYPDIFLLNESMEQKVIY